MNARMERRRATERPAEQEAHKRIAQERLRDIELLGGPYDPTLERGEGPNLRADPEDAVEHALNNPDPNALPC